MTRWEYRLADVPSQNTNAAKHPPPARDDVWREPTHPVSVARREAEEAHREAQRCDRREERAALERLLAELGAEGWELVSTRDLAREDGWQGPVLVFKRPAGGAL